MKPESAKAKGTTENVTKLNLPRTSQDEAANQIRDRLKMYYMCTRHDHRQILTFLYDPNEGKISQMDSILCYSRC